MMLSFAEEMAYNGHRFAAFNTDEVTDTDTIEFFRNPVDAKEYCLVMTNDANYFQSLPIESVIDDLRAVLNSGADTSENEAIELTGFAKREIDRREILENNFTIRIHLDKTTKDNGALKVLNASHKKGIYRMESIKLEEETETICEVEKGGIMIMKPLIFHASNKTTNNERRRVIHIEFSNQKLPSGLEWSEKTNFI